MTDNDLDVEPAPASSPSQALLTRAGQYLMDLGYIMRRAPQEPMDIQEYQKIAEAINVVIVNLMTVRNALSSESSRSFENGELKHSDFEDSKDSEVHKVPKGSKVHYKGSTSHLAPSKWDHLGAKPRSAWVTDNGK